MKIFNPVFEGELAIFQDENLPAPTHGGEIFKAVSSSGDYLPRLQLMTSNAGLCKDGKFPINHYALVRDQEHSDLGETVDVALLSWRPKALDTSGDEVIAIHDPKLVDGKPTGEFARIAEASMGQDSGCMYGSEYLVYIPSVKEFATFFMGTKTARRESPNVMARLKKAATLRAQKIETKKYTYFSPQCINCSTPFELPDKEAVVAQIEKFNNPQLDEPEAADEATDRAR